MKPQTSDLVVGKLKRKVLREPVGVALHGKIQRFGGNAVEVGQVGIEHHLLTATRNVCRSTRGGAQFYEILRARGNFWLNQTVQLVQNRFGGVVMKTKFQWLLIGLSGAVLAAPVQADPSQGNAGNHAPAAHPAPRAGVGPSFRGAPARNYGAARIQNYGGARTYSTGPRFSPSIGTAQRDAAWRQIPRSNFQNGLNSGSQSQLPLSTSQQQRFQGSRVQGGSNTAPTTNTSDVDRKTSGTGTGTFQNTRVDPSTQSGSVNGTSATTQNRVFTRRSADWQPTWDRTCDHWWKGHRCRFVNNSWIIFDFGFYPWAYGYGYPYSYGYPYNYDYGYGYDYYPSGYDPGYYGDGQNYGQDEYYGQDGYESPDQNADSPDQNADSPVAAAQERLTREGYYRGALDGVLNPETRRALTAFQTDQGLDPTGYLTRDTRQALGLRP